MTWPFGSAEGDSVDAQVKQDAEVAVAQLRMFISRYDGVEVVAGSRIGRQLEAVRRAVEAYDDVKRQLAEAVA